jgi:hypothetical protein
MGFMSGFNTDDILLTKINKLIGFLVLLCPRIFIEELRKLVESRSLDSRPSQYLDWACHEYKL